MQGQELGAIAGYSWAGKIKQLWVDEPCRGQGLGGRLLRAAIAEATVRGCQSIWLMSHDFQAPGFYEKYGFYRAAELEIGHQGTLMSYCIYYFGRMALRETVLIRNGSRCQRPPVSRPSPPVAIRKRRT